MKLRNPPCGPTGCLCVKTKPYVNWSSLCNVQDWATLVVIIPMAHASPMLAHTTSLWMASASQYSLSHLASSRPRKTTNGGLSFINCLSRQPMTTALAPSIPFLQADTRAAGKTPGQQLPRQQPQTQTTSDLILLFSPTSHKTTICYKLVFCLLQLHIPEQYTRLFQITTDLITLNLQPHQLIWRAITLFSIDEDIHLGQDWGQVLVCQKPVFGEDIVPVKVHNAVPIGKTNYLLCFKQGWISSPFLSIERLPFKENHIRDKR